MDYLLCRYFGLYLSAGLSIVVPVTCYGYQLVVIIVLDMCDICGYLFLMILSLGLSQCFPRAMLFGVYIMAYIHN